MKGLVTPVASLRRSVAIAHAPICTHGSALSDCESMNIWPSQPSASTARATAAEAEVFGPPARQSSSILVSLVRT